MLSFWEKNSFLNYDYIIVGAGLVGLSTAINLKERHPEHSVLLLEAGFFPSGASTKNAGFACFGSLTELLSDLAIMSESETAKLVEDRWKGLEKLKNRLGNNQIGYICHGGYEVLTENQLDALKHLESVNRIIKPIFGSSVFSLKSEEINTFGFDRRVVKELVYNQFEAQIDTGKMMQSLIQFANHLGVQILNSAKVNQLSEQENSVDVQLENGITFSAQQVGVCTNAFTKQLLPDLEINPGRGQVLVTKPIENLRFKGVFHLDEGYYYFRNYGNRVIFGGGRNLDFEAENTTEFALTEQIQKTLIEKLTTIILPESHFEVEHSWAGIMAFGKNKKPIISRISDRICAGVRLGGMGVAIGSNVGEMLADKILEAN